MKRRNNQKHFSKKKFCFFSYKNVLENDNWRVTTMSVISMNVEWLQASSLICRRLMLYTVCILTKKIDVMSTLTTTPGNMATLIIDIFSHQNRENDIHLHFQC